jgi:uncharacterized OB-fold protein
MSDGKQALADWTTGAEAIVYRSCVACGSSQYFRRSFCCTCGAPDPIEKHASGEGTVYATSLVVRTATPETRAHVPYNIVLVDTVEGFRMMAHGDNDLVIGDKVVARFTQFRRSHRSAFRKDRIMSPRAPHGVRDARLHRQ